MTSWYQFKLLLQHASGFSMDSLHVALGPLLLLLFAWLLGSSVARWTPWLLVLALEVLNELHDLSVERWRDPGQQYGEGLKDILLTMVVPTTMLWLARHRPWLFHR
jgi:hypothetical protein